MLFGLIVTVRRKKLLDFRKMNNSTNFIILQKRSIYLLQLQLPWNIAVFLVLAPFAALSNGLTVFILLKGGKKFRSHHYLLLLHMVLISTISTFNSTFLIGVKRLYLTITKKSEIMSPFECSLYFISHEIFLLVDLLNVMFVAFDRLFAIAKPVKYKYMTNSYKISTILIPWLLSLINITAKYTGRRIFPDSVMVICLLNNLRTKLERKVIASLVISVCSTTIMFFISSIVMIKRNTIRNKKKYRKLKPNSRYLLLITSTIDAIIYIGYVVAVVFGVATMTEIAQRELIVRGPVSIAFYYVTLLSRFFVMYFFNRTFRCFIKSHIIRYQAPLVLYQLRENRTVHQQAR